MLSTGRYIPGGHQKLFIKPTSPSPHLYSAVDRPNTFEICRPKWTLDTNPMAILLLSSSKKGLTVSTPAGMKIESHRRKIEMSRSRSTPRVWQ